MNFFEFVLKLNGKFHWIRNISQSFVKRAVLNPEKRRKLNTLYHKFSFYEKSIFHALFSKIFRDGNHYSIDGFWLVKFAGKELKMPLQSESFALDWETAISIVAHDYEIKAYYEEAIMSTNPPKTFLDIGSNFGTHSLLFLKCGIRAVSIEPNPECKAFFKRMCRYNNVEGEWYAIAMGEEKCETQIVFPEGETWLGSLKITEFGNRGKVKSYPVSVNRLDDFLEMNNIEPDLIKIDTEGFEEGVLRGGENFPKQKYPEVIFEANSNSERENLKKQFQGLGYHVLDLKSKSVVELNALNFQKETNFLARKGRDE
ncbi:FkbM family methyltransferase [Algoriphagus halophytocola]|uniref:FkbM family methyltransferase n=1 Tax=Algoriphagus halophytocola TaxID=2991499 RepID=UPI0022DD187F|nr:FkbM family methyltransferase [Algoriphagus sp. TR-M9]WBL41316.1 FkbM family methyltransferase [Algoriphagus sp. TR-M9]